MKLSGRGMSISYKQVICHLYCKPIVSLSRHFAESSVEEWGSSICGSTRLGWAAHVTVSPEVLKELDLAQGALGQDLLAEDIGDLLDSDTLVGLVVHRGTIKYA